MGARAGEGPSLERSAAETGILSASKLESHAIAEERNGAGLADRRPTRPVHCFPYGTFLSRRSPHAPGYIKRWLRARLPEEGGREHGIPQRPFRAGGCPRPDRWWRRAPSLTSWPRG